MNISLRERKKAQVKLGLLNAMTSRLGKQSFEQISVRDLCVEVEISEATFFNYFPRKNDLLVYFIQVWSIEVAWHCENSLKNQSAIEQILEIFRFTGKRLEHEPWIMEEIIKTMMALKREYQYEDISSAEKLMAFPDYPNIRQFRAEGLLEIFSKRLQRGVMEGALSEQIPIDETAAELIVIFFGVPIIAMRKADPNIHVPMYQSMVNKTLQPFLL